ncbi:MAG TPA: PAS domain S-box protein [Casimicrobiaceae bacterium]|nr:PAS domain S-box protein [Casimicrobiaceae bacterium]
MSAEIAVEDRPRGVHVVSSDPRGEFRFRQLLERLPAGAYTCDPEGLITYFNPQAVEIWGRAPKLNHPDDRFCGSFKFFASDGAAVRHDQCWMALALKDRREHNGKEIIIERPDGRRVTALAHASPFLDEDGRLLGAVNVLVDITERKRTEQALRDAHDKLAHYVVERTAELTELSRHLMRVAETDKAKLAAELHDEMGSLLTVLSMRLNRLGEQLADPRLAAEHVQTMDLVRSMVVSQRRIATSLRPVLLDTFGLGVALRHYVQDWGKHAGLQAETGIADRLPALPANASLALFRIAQEALTNVAKHSNASSVNVTLNSEGTRVTLSIDDDGVGLAPGVAHLASSHGIVGMRERLLEFGGVLLVEQGRRGRGTRVTASMLVAR